MKLSKRKALRLLREMHHDSDISSQQAVPEENDYDKVRRLLDSQPAMVDHALKMVMTAAGATCPVSTRQAVMDHLRDYVDAQTLPPGATIGIPVGAALAEAKVRAKVRSLLKESIPFAEERANDDNITAILDMISSDIVDKLMGMGPTDTLELVKTFGGEWSKDEIFQAVDLLVDEGEVYFDDDGTLFLIPEHSAELERSGVY
tara:strand:- start:17 stop:625 length:609 start_codon:yes stop_codon:yes gene_type:complete